MPEGPEVFFLALHLKKLGLDCFSYGKHLFISQVSASADELRDISFGLYGRVFYDPVSKKLDKIKAGPISGDDKIVLSKQAKENNFGLGPDYMNMTREQVNDFVFGKIGNSKRQLAALLLDQDEIAGLGVAWISEIAHLAGFTEIEMAGKGKDLDELKMHKLVDAMFQVQSINKLVLIEEIKDLDSVSFVNSWFENLYRIRQPYIQAYRKKRPVLIGSRQFWL